MLVRTFTLSESRVTLSTPPVLSGGVETVFELVWRAFNTLIVWGKNDYSFLVG